MNNMNWDNLRYFIAVAEQGSLSAAAQALQSNQPTVGRKIDALERSLGMKLFTRNSNGLSLTDEGYSILENSQLIESGVHNIQRMINGQADKPSGAVRLALPEGLAVEMLTPHLDKFYEQFPNIKLILNISTKSANLLRGEADIAIRLYRPAEANLVVKKLADMQLGLFASNQYLKQNKPVKSIRDLSQQAFISYGDELQHLDENQWLLKHTQPSRNRLASDSTLTRLQATNAGLGVSIQPLVIGNKNKLSQLLPKTKLPSHPVWLVYHNDLRQIERIRVVINYLIDYFEMALN